MRDSSKVLTRKLHVDFDVLGAPAVKATREQ